jgi:DNA invertase Pin-like site-specific DNA recombinase
MTINTRAVALYLRVSTDGQSTALQRRDLEQCLFSPDSGESMLLRLKSGRRPRFSRLLQTRSQRCLP